MLLPNEDPRAETARETPRRTADSLLLVDQVLLAGAKEGVLLGLGLETTVSKLGRGVNELELDLLEGRALGVDQERLSEGNDSLADTRGAALDHDPVLVDNTVVGEATHGGDGLGSEIKLGRGVGGVCALANAVDLLVDLGTVMVTVLTGTGNRELDSGRMPGTDTGHLTQTLVGLSGKLFGAPTGSDTLVTVTFGDTNDVNHLVLLKDRGDVNRLLKVLLGPVDLIGNGATVELDLHQVGLLLAELDLADLSVSQNTDDLTVLCDSLQLLRDGLSVGLGELFGVAGKGLLFGAVPVLVEATLDFVRQVLGPDGGEGSETSGSLDVANDTDNDHGGSLEDGDSLDNLFFVHLGAGTVELTDNVGHAGLVAHEGGQMDGLGRVIPREGLDLASVSAGSLAGQEPKRSMTGVLKLAMRHFFFVLKKS